LAATLLWVGGSAAQAATHPIVFRMVSRFPEGHSRKVYLVEHDLPGLGHLRVLKVHRDRSQHRMGQTTPATRHRIAMEALTVPGVLMQFPRFVRRFGNVFPETYVVQDAAILIKPTHTKELPAESGVTLQAEAGGVRHAELPPALRAVAQQEVQAFAEMAERLVGFSPLTGERLRYTHNFRDNYTFDPQTGHIVSAFDAISDAKRPPGQ
jgi:hypothetical protein